MKAYEYFQSVKDKEMTDKPKHKMTRAEAIACFSKHMPIVQRPEDTIDFYIEAGMLEIVEEEKVWVCGMPFNIIEEDLNKKGYKIIKLKDA